MKALSHLTILIILHCLYACDTKKNIGATNHGHGKNSDYNTYLYADSLKNTKNDSAFYYFNKVAVSSKDSLLTAAAYNNMGIIQNDAGDYFGSEESLLQSLRLLDEQNEKHHEYFASGYTELGNDSRSLKNYDEAVRYYDLAIKFSKDSANKLVRLNNKATALRDKKQYDQAINIYNDIIQNNNNSPIAYSRILSNIAYTKWLKDPNYHAAPELLSALQIRKNEKDDWGLKANYSHLSDYYSHTRPDAALIYAVKMYTIAQQLKSPDDEMEALQKLIALSPVQTAKKYFIYYQSLSDSLQTARNNAKNQFALIRYDAEKNKSDNLILQKDNAEKKVRIIQLLTITAGIIVFAVCFFIWYRKRRQRLMHEQQLKTSQKVHDVVANGLYRIMTKIEHDRQIEKEQLLDDMEILYEQSRDISYEQPGNTSTAISGLLQSFSTPATRVLIVGSSEAIWNRLDTKVQKELEHVLLELMTNMKKHSHAKNVVIRFDQAAKEIRLQYNDDGIGLPGNFRYGNGLTSTENRIRSIGGRINFDPLTNQGLKIQVYIPII